MKKLFFILISIIFLILIITFISASRLPTPGGDSDAWGIVLNDFLSRIVGNNATELNLTMVNGTNIYSSSINTTHIKDGTITSDDLADNSVNSSIIDLTEVTLSDFTNDANYLDKDDGGTINGDVIINGNLSLIGSYLNATVTNQYLNGSFLPSITNLFDIGSSSLFWNNMYINKIFATDWTNVTITESQVSDADWWDASDDVDDDEIAEGKIGFSTSCSAGNHLYVSGNDLACEADAGNSSFNQTLTDTLYAPNTTAGIQALINNTDVYSTYNATYAGYATDGVTIKYQNISNIPTCSGTDKLIFDGTTLSCDTDVTGNGIWTNTSGNATFISGRVGIGTTNPAFSLFEINGTGTGTYPFSITEADGTTSLFVIESDGASLYVRDGSGVSGAVLGGGSASHFYQGAKFWDKAVEITTNLTLGNNLIVGEDINVTGNLNATKVCDWSGNCLDSVGGIDGTGGWTNDSVITSTDLNVNLTTGNLTVSNGRIGAGTSNLTNILTVGASASQDGFELIDSDGGPLVRIRKGSSGQGYAYYYNSSADANILLNPAGSSYITGGEVGIGTDSPGALLDVGASGGTDGEILVTSSAGRIATLEADDDGNYIHIGSQSAHDFNIVRNDVSRIYIDNAEILFRNSSEDSVMTLEDSGELGIGTTDPTRKLTIYGENADEDTGPNIRLITDADAYPQFDVLAFTHDNVGMSFDSYYNGSWISSDAGSNFAIYKIGDVLGWWYDSGVSPGDPITWNTNGLSMDTSGNVMAKSVHDINLGDASTETRLETNYLQNYIIEINSTMSHDAVMIPTDIITNYCADIDGCRIRGIMHYYDGAYSAMEDNIFFYDPVTLKYRIQDSSSAGPVLGIDNNNGETNIWNIGSWNACFLTDYEIIAGVAQNDGEIGLWLHWDTAGYNHAGKRCVLVIED